MFAPQRTIILEFSAMSSLVLTLSAPVRPTPKPPSPQQIIAGCQFWQPHPLACAPAMLDDPEKAAPTPGKPARNTPSTWSARILRTSAARWKRDMGGVTLRRFDANLGARVHQGRHVRLHRHDE